MNIMPRLNMFCDFGFVLDFVLRFGYFLFFAIRLKFVKQINNSYDFEKCVVFVGTTLIYISCAIWCVDRLHVTYNKFTLQHLTSRYITIFSVQNSLTHSTFNQLLHGLQQQLQLQPLSKHINDLVILNSCS